jgi:hypothetical protein
MTEEVTRRQALARAGVAVAGMEIALAALGGSAQAAPEGVQGAWVIQPTTSGGPAGFRAVAAFAAGGVFLTIGSDEPGTGVGEWRSPTAETFAFTYLNFHFDPDGKLNNTVKVRAVGAFSGRTLKGKATLTAHDPGGHALFPPRRFTFSGARLFVEEP